MLHSIATCQCAISPPPSLADPSSLLYVFFVNQQGQLGSYVQTGDGVWHTTGPGTAFAAVQLLPTDSSENQITALSIIALDLQLGWYFNIISSGSLIVLGSDHNLYVAFFTDENAWSEFSLLPNNEDLYFADFAATNTLDDTVVIAQATQANNGFYAYDSLRSSLSNMTDPSLISGSESLTGPAASVVFTVTYPSSGTQINEFIYVLGLTGNKTSVCSAMVGSPNNDGTITWTQIAAVPPLSLYSNPTAVVLVVGYPSPTLQAILLFATEIPYLVWYSSSPGQFFGVPLLPSWVTYGFLPNNANYSTTAWSTAAAGVGWANNLQVVGLQIESTQPLLISQDTTGTWYPLSASQPNNPPNQPTQLPGLLEPQFTDLAIGMGPQGFLQVAYLAQDGSVFINFQDTYGSWGWYAGLTGTGLP